MNNSTRIYVTGFLTGILVLLLLMSFQCNDTVCDVPFSTSVFHFSVTERK